MRVAMSRIITSARLLGLAGTLAAFAAAANADERAGPVAPPPYAVRGMPGPGQLAMKVLAGDWRVRMTLYAAVGTPQKPVVSTDLVAHRELVADGRFLTDETKGTMAGQPYFRRGTLGYSNMDGRFEWVTQDALNANMMIYRGASRSGYRFPVSLSGTFTDQGLLGEATAGKTLRQRTVITILDPDHHRFDIYFTPPGGPERLVDRKEYSRIN